MPRREKASNDPNPTVTSRRMARGDATTQANGDLDLSMTDYSSGAPNVHQNPASTATITQIPHPSRIERPSQASSSQLQAPRFKQVRDNLDISSDNRGTRNDLLREAFFADYNHDASNADLGDPAEMQKKDPLGTQIWKLYSRAKTQLPNHERMENLTWRMMAMRMKRPERENAQYVVRHDSSRLWEVTN